MTVSLAASLLPVTLDRQKKKKWPKNQINENPFQDQLLDVSQQLQTSKGQEDAAKVFTKGKKISPGAEKESEKENGGGPQQQLVGS